VALTSVPYDRGLKAGLYARHHFREFWVVDAARRATFVHREPEGEGWRSIVERGPDEALAIAALPGFSMRLAAV
jgi:Uma2 family endonuclease